MQYTQPKNVTRNVDTLMKQHPSNSNKILFELCQQLDAQSDINNLYDDSSSSSTSSNNEDNNDQVVEQNIVNLLHSSTFDEDIQEGKFQDTTDASNENEFTVFNCKTKLGAKSIIPQKQKWEGAYLDTGAQSTVIGLRQALVYCRFMDKKFKPTGSYKRFLF